ncbi:hypothetical protein [Wenyingzhuangia sp. IMCC45467]
MTVHDFLESVSDFDSLTKKEQVKLIAFFHCVENEKQYFKANDITKEFEINALLKPSNISAEITRLKKSKPTILIESKQGFAFHRTAKKELEETYLAVKHKRDVSNTLRDLITELTGNEQKKYLEEAISCFEIKSFRASIIMTWLLAMDIMYEYILNPKNLTIFNSAIQTHGKYKKIKINSKDDFSSIKESDFIELLRVSKIITNDTRKILDEKLGVRNSCAHPNSMKILDYKAIGYIQDLVINVIKKYQ